MLFTLSIRRIYMLRSLLVGNVSLSPPWLASNGSIPLRSTTIFFAWIYSPKPPPLFPALDAIG
jgi:hypothetical protein